MGQRRPGMTDIEVIRADIHKQLLKRLAWVCRETGSEVVLSSAWRCLDDYRDELIKHLRMEGIRYIGDTLSLPLRLETQDGKCLKLVSLQFLFSGGAPSPPGGDVPLG